MRLRMKVLLLALAMAFAYSTNSFAASVWSDVLTIDLVFTEDSNVIVANTSGGGVYKEGCVANKWVFSSESEARMNRVYSTMLTALASGKKVKMYNRDECGPWNYHSIYAIQIIK